MLGYSGEPEDALPDLVLAQEALANEAEPRLKALVESNLVTFRALAGQFAEAERSIAGALKSCADVGDRVLHQHLCWAQGLIYHGRGELDLAAVSYEQAMRRFDTLGQPGYAAMAALDLALVRDEQGLYEEVVALASAALAALKHFKHVSGVTAALSLLRETVPKQQVPRQILKEVREKLHSLLRDSTVNLAGAGA